jgi:hypothetical protein
MRMAIPGATPAFWIILGWIVMIGVPAALAAPDRTPAAACRAAIAAAEASRHIPDEFLSAIARVESGRPDPLTGALLPWPWTINAEGTGSYFASKEEAIAAVRGLQARGVRSIDVGCLQVNLQQHPDAFASLDLAFDPTANAQFAAGFLIELFGQTHSWPRAAASYHSQTPTLGSAYQRRVLAEWAIPEPPDSLGEGAIPPLSSVSATRSEPGSSARASGTVFSRPAAFAIRGMQGGGRQAGARSLGSYRLYPVRVSQAAGRKRG